MATAQRPVNNRIQAVTSIEGALSQLVQSLYELNIVGPRCDTHWRRVFNKLGEARKRIDECESFVTLAIAPFGEDLVRENAKIVARHR